LAQKIYFRGLGIGDWGLGIGDWGLGAIHNPQMPNTQSPIPNPQSIYKYLSINHINLIFIQLYKIIK
jgi:hypothetical protein